MARRRDAPTRGFRWRRTRALLASGLVLGVGAAMTLAAWNDSEHGAATFTSGQFGIVGATDGVDFTEHPVAGSAAVLNFQVPPTAMAPGTTTYALFSVRTTDPSVAGTVQLGAGSQNSADLGQYLTYGVRAVPGATCDQATFDGSSSVVVPSGSTLTAGADSTQALAANGGVVVNYCYAVTLPADAPNAAQGLTLTAQWEFAATSS